MAALLIPRRNRGMRTRLGCLSHKSDSYNDFTAILPDKPNRALKRLSTEEATRWADSFDVLLSHKYGLAAFRAFLKTEFSEENLEFWLACEDFKKTRSAAKLASKAQRIFEEFIDVQAPREVNIDFQTRELTRRNMQEPSLTCFDQAQGKVHSLMEKDSYPRRLPGSHHSPVCGRALRAVLKLVRPSPVQSIVSHTGCWGPDPETVRKERGEGEEKAKAHDSCGFPEWKSSANSAHLSILVAHLMTPAATPSQPLIFQGWRLRVIFRMTVKELSFSHEEGNPKSSR
ncbi:regulator of G-protein signaling 8 isoform X1 [Balearica regulorum gibbericeps]|uniref:regulator of G-protein signaling 8 isoform X1 n=1 Tax=Balearica regulorum gibbericeps TaxID=100784 RepID=UPI003F613EDE